MNRKSPVFTQEHLLNGLDQSIDKKVLETIHVTNKAINDKNEKDRYYNKNDTKITKHQSKRIIWGKEIPHKCILDLDPQVYDNFIMTMGSNPWITIKPINIKDELVTNSLANPSGSPYSNRVFELESLRNYFKLNEPELTEHFHHSRFRYDYFLSLLDPTTPRLTNCGHYYRMRYAVYAAIKNPTNRLATSINSDWRKDDSLVQDLSIKQKLMHIGEIHLYTIVPEYENLYQKNDTTDLNSKISYIHYENISFFLNQIPLNREEMKILQATESDFNPVVHQFRCYLKYLNSITVTVQITNFKHHPHTNQNNFHSTYLLEQLKYPKSSDQFINPDRSCEQFLRVQSLMLTRYLVPSTTVTSKISSPRIESKSDITGDMFAQNLIRLNESSLNY